MAQGQSQANVVFRDDPANRTASGTLDNAEDVVSIDAAGSGTILWEITTGLAGGAVVTFEASIDSGSTWFAVNVIRLSTDADIGTTTSTFPDRGYFRRPGYTNARMRLSTAGTGTSTGRMCVSFGPSTGAVLATDVRAAAHGADPTAVAAGSDKEWQANRQGIPFVMGGHPNVVRASNRYSTDPAGAVIGSASTTGSVVLILTQLTIHPDPTVSNDVQVTVGFSTTTTVPSDADDCVFDGVVNGSTPTIVIGNGGGMIGVGNGDMDLRADFDQNPAGGSIGISFSYYTIES